MNKKIWQDQKFIASLWFKRKATVLEIYLTELNLGTLQNMSDRNRQIILNKTKRELIREIYNSRRSK